jgi:hypothetical protein
MEEDVFHLLATPRFVQPRTLSVAGARVLAGQLREAVGCRHERTIARVGASQACPFDLHALAPVPDEILRLGPDDPERLAPALAWRLINELRETAVVVKDPPIVTVSADPDDNCLLAIAAAGTADFLVTGDKHDLLGLRLYEETRINTVRDFLALTRRLPCQSASRVRPQRIGCDRRQ